MPFEIYQLRYATAGYRSLHRTAVTLQVYSSTLVSDPTLERLIGRAR